MTPVVSRGSGGCSVLQGSAQGQQSKHSMDDWQKRTSYCGYAGGHAVSSQCAENRMKCAAVDSRVIVRRDSATLRQLVPHDYLPSHYGQTPVEILSWYNTP